MNRTPWTVRKSRTWAHVRWGARLTRTAHMRRLANLYLPWGASYEWVNGS